MIDWITFLIGLGLGFGIGYLLSQSLISHHVVAMGEQFVGSLAQKLGRDESISLSLEMMRLDESGEEVEEEDKPRWGGFHESGEGWERN